MSPNEAKCILEQLAHGIDPDTGEQLQQIGVLNSPIVIRALFLAVSALSQESSGPSQPRAKARRISTQESVSLVESPVAGKTWYPEEDANLLIAYDAGSTVDELASAHGRTRGAIAARLVRLGRIKERSEVYVRQPKAREGTTGEA